MRLRIIGDSHVAALAIGWHQLTNEGFKADCEVAIGCLGSGVYLPSPFFALGDGGIGWTCEEYAKGFFAIAGRETLTREAEIVYGLCIGFHTGEIVRAPCWREFRPWRVPAAGLTPVSDKIVREAATEYSRYVFALYDAMLKLGIAFFVIEAPPFREEHPCIAEEGTRPEIAAEIDRLFRQTIADALAERGVRRVPPPPAAINERGFLGPEYAVGGPDPHHANGAYGKLLLIDVLKAAADFR